MFKNHKTITKHENMTRYCRSFLATAVSFPHPKGKKCCYISFFGNNLLEALVLVIFKHKGEVA